MKLTLENITATNEYTIAQVDKDGNGIIVLRGSLGGCGFMNDTEREPRLQALAQMVAAWNEKYGDES